MKIFENKEEYSKTLKSKEVVNLKGEDGKDGAKGEDGRDGKNGIDGKNGKDGIDGLDGLNGNDGKDGKDGSPDSPDEIKVKLESLKGEERLDASAVKNLPEFTQNIIQEGFSVGAFETAIKAGANTTVIKDSSGAYVVSSTATGSGTVNNGLQGYFGYYPLTGNTIDDQSVLFTTGINIGVGTVTPSEKLDVNGNINIPTTTSGVGIIKQNGSPFIHSFGTNNLFLGSGAGNLTTTGLQNTGIGVGALSNIVDGVGNLAIGYHALSSITTLTPVFGSNNVAIGYNSMELTTDGENTVAIGAVSARFLGYSRGSTFIGVSSGYNASGAGGFYNTAIGYNTMSGVSGYFSVAIGANAFPSMGGTNNTGVGYSVGPSLTSGSHNTLIGDAADMAAGTYDYSAAIGAGAVVGASNTMVLGGTGAAAVKVAIGATTANSTLQVVGSISTGYRAITGARTLDATDRTVNCTANTFAVTLPTAVGISGREYIIKNSGSGAITINTTSAQTIDVQASGYFILNQYDSITVTSDGANWIIINMIII